MVSIRHALYSALAAVSTAQLHGTPGLEFLYTVNATLGESWSYGDFGMGSRVAIPIIGGSFEGPKMSGTVQNLGADWGVVDTTGVFWPDTRYNLRTDDGADIYIQTNGPSQPDGSILLRGVFQTGDPEYTWLNYVVAMGVLRTPTSGGNYVVIDMWHVRILPPSGRLLCANYAAIDDPSLRRTGRRQTPRPSLNDGFR